MEGDTRRHAPEISYSEALVQESPDALIALSSTGEILFWNHGAVVLFGFSGEEAIGRSLDEFVIPPGLRDEARLALEDALAGKPVLFETKRRRKDGSQVDVDVSMRAVRDAQGQILFVAANK